MTHNSQNVRYISPDDFDSWAVLWETYTQNEQIGISTRDLFNRLLDPMEQIFCLVAEDDKNLAGFLIYATYSYAYSIKKVCYVDELYVAENARKKGVGRGLMNTLEQIGKEQNWRRLLWKTGPNNQVAQGFYDKFATKLNNVFYTLELNSD